MITRENENTIVEFAKTEDYSTLAIGHNDQAHLFFKQLAPPPRKINDNISLDEIKEGQIWPKSILFCGFSTINDIRIFKKALASVKSNVLSDPAKRSDSNPGDNLFPNKIWEILEYNDLG